MANRHKKVILLIETASEYGRGILRGIAKYRYLHTKWSVYTEDAGNKISWPHLENWGADGIITRDLAYNDKILKLGIPVIFRADERSMPGFPDIPIIKTNAKAIGRMGAEHLTNLGLQHFAYCGLGDEIWSKNRADSFAKRLAEKGFNTEFYWQPRTQKLRRWDTEQTRLAHWLESLEKPCGIMACNDKRARHITEAAELVNIKMPEEMAVLGVDNDELICSLSNPGTSSICLNTELAGYEAAALLDKLMAGEKPSQYSIIVQPTHVNHRRSTDTLAVKDTEVRTALQYIYENSNQLIQVIDVAEHTGLSRRVLEKRFRLLLKRSVYQEIQRVRVERIVEILVETHKSISQIAVMCGLPSERHLSRLFCKFMGMSPRSYRKMHSKT